MEPLESFQGRIQGGGGKEAAASAPQIFALQIFKDVKGGQGYNHSPQPPTVLPTPHIGNLPPQPDF